MYTTKKIIFIVLLLLSFLSITAYSQEVGIIYDKKEADNLYGPVLESKTISANNLGLFLLSTEKKVMFRLENNKYTILGDGRSLLYCSDNFIESNQVFNMYSKSKVLELIYKGNGKTVTLENRKKVFSITSGDYTLETSWPCPPYCSD